MADKTVLATLDWTYNQLSWQQELKSSGINWKIVIPSGKPYASYYAMAISAYAAHPAAARLFLEYMYSPTGQNLWLEGGAVPATITAMQKGRHREQGRRSTDPSASRAAGHRQQCAGHCGKGACCQRVGIRSRLAAGPQDAPDRSE